MLATHTEPTDLRGHLGQAPKFRDEDARTRDFPKFPRITAESCRYGSQIFWLTGHYSYSQSQRRMVEPGWALQPEVVSSSCNSPLTFWMIPDKLLNFPELQLSHLYKGNMTALLRDCWESEWNHICKASASPFPGYYISVSLVVFSIHPPGLMGAWFWRQRINRGNITIYATFSLLWKKYIIKSLFVL